MRKLFQLIIFIALLSPIQAQSLEWVSSMGSIGQDYCSKMTVDNGGNKYITGVFSFTADFDPGPGFDTLVATTTSNYDAYVAKYDTLGHLVWAKQMGGPNWDNPYHVNVDQFGNVYVCGYFRDSTDFDPGPSTYFLNSNGQEDIFIVKLDNNGNFQWAKSIGGTTTDWAYSCGTDQSGNVYVTGNYQGTADFDPGPSVFNLTGAAYHSTFLLKLTSNGDFIWVKKIGGTQSVSPRYMELNSNNMIYLSGSFTGTADFDPGPGTFNLGAGGSSLIFIVKLDANGNLVWAKRGPNCPGYGITRDSSENFIITGEFSGTIDFNAGAGVANLTATGAADAFILKLDSLANFSWVKQITGPDLESGTCIEVDSLDNIYAAGRFTNPTDFDPGPGTYLLNPTGVSDAYIAKYNSVGNFISAFRIGGTGQTNVSSVILDTNYNIFIAGNHDYDTDFDPDTSSFIVPAINDFYIARYSQDVCANFTLSIDSVSVLNCTSPSGFVSSHCINGYPPYSYSWNTVPTTIDSILNPDTSGIYMLTATDGLNCSRTIGAIVSGPNYSSFDLNVNLIASSFQPGFPAQLWLHGMNESCSQISGNMQIILDTLVTFAYSVPTPDFVNGDTLRWNFNNINFDSIAIVPHIYIITSNTASIGDTISFLTSINPTIGDFDSTNNYKTYLYHVINGYDPNDKKIFPSGECNSGYILNNDRLTYTVRFQNTGNSDAINIYVLDSLDSHLDLNSVRIVSNSHPLITEVLPGNVLKFRFDNIYLPDSNSNEPLSHGYVIFEVTPNTGVSSNTPISNTSHIFFDFNPPVTTNTVSNVLVSTIPNSTSTLTQSFCNSININGYLYNTSGTFIQYHNNYLGCDSVITLNLTLLDSSSSNLTASNCNSFTLNSTTYYSSGVYNQTLTNSVGCDSLITLNLTIFDSTSNYASAAACYSYTLNSTTYNSSGVYYQTFTNSNGCDSLVILDLIIFDTTSNYLPVSACSSYTINGNTYSTTGIYQQTLISSAGCDSILTIDLTINNVDNSVSQSGFTLTANEPSAFYQWIDCDNLNFPLAGENFQSFTATTNGSYAVIIYSNGCTDTSACQTIFGFGIEDYNFSSGLSASPNPTHSTINIQSKIELKNATLVVTDLNGKNLLQRNQLNGNSFQIDLTELKAGMYFVHLYFEGKEAVIKVVKN